MGLLGAPSSAGASTPGLDRGPRAVREGGLVELLRRSGSLVEDHADVPGFRWRPDPEHPCGRNAEAVARVASATADGVARILAAGQTPLVLGGDCTITIGVIAGFMRAGLIASLLYADSGPDLYTPAVPDSGDLDATGLAHLLAVPGHLPMLASIGPCRSAANPQQVICYGDCLEDGDYERRMLDELGILRVGADEVHAGVRPAVARALTAIEAIGAPFVLHCDVDVLAFSGAPLADVPDSGGGAPGLTVSELAASLAMFVASDCFAGLVVTEINPDHVPEPRDLRHFLERLAAALATRSPETG